MKLEIRHRRAGTNDSLMIAIAMGQRKYEMRPLYPSAKWKSVYRSKLYNSGSLRHLCFPKS